MSIEPLLDELELIFLLAINPGWGGQKFLPEHSEDASPRPAR